MPFVWWALKRVADKRPRDSDKDNTLTITKVAFSWGWDNEPPLSWALRTADKGGNRAGAPKIASCITKEFR